MVNSVGSTPLSTHDSWNRVSNLAKALPWLASGALRWATILTGQTSLPSSLTLSEMVEHSLSYWAGLS